MNKWYLKEWATALLMCAAMIGTHPDASAQDYALSDFDGAGKLKPEFIKQGKKLYVNHCSGCHGMKGDGNGPAAYGLSPKPRDFSRAVFKFRSMDFGSIPTDADIERSIREGIPGTSMPSFRLFADNDIKALAQYIKVFDTTGKWKEIPVKVALDPEPQWIHDPVQWKAKAAAGKVTFDQVCAVCHGPGGAGDGIGGLALVDNWLHPVKPADLRKPHDIGSGPSLDDAFRAITTGLYGSPMVGYGASFEAGKRWELVAYIHFLRQSYNNPDLSLPELTQSPSTETSTNSPENEFE